MKFWPVACLLVLLIALEAPSTFAASQASFSGTSGAIQQAFVAVQSAGKSGGDISNLVVKLNVALGLVQKAAGENATSPSQASVDLQSALGIAQEVQSSAASAGQQGVSARQVQFVLSIASAAAVVGVAIAIYVYGDRIYRRLWLQVYHGHVVRKNG